VLHRTVWFYFDYITIQKNALLQGGMEWIRGAEWRTATKTATPVNDAYDAYGTFNKFMLRMNRKKASNFHDMPTRPPNAFCVYPPRADADSRAFTQIKALSANSEPPRGWIRDSPVRAIKGALTFSLLHHVVPALPHIGQSRDPYLRSAPMWYRSRITRYSLVLFSGIRHLYALPATR
jgi:hypothetical protein